jgi:uncharacterized protein
VKNYLGILFFSVGIFCFGPIAGAESFVVPTLVSPVQDEAGFFSARTRGEVATFLAMVRSKGGPQIQVLTVVNLQGLPIEEATIRVADAWTLGDKDKDNGILFLVSKEERKMRIEVGQGLEGDLPDVIAKRIISRVVTPLFKSGQMDRGLTEGVTAILSYIAPQFLEGREAPSHEQIESQGRGSNLSFLFIIGLFLLISFLRILMGRGGFASSGYHRGGGYIGGGGFGGGRSSGGWSGGGGGFSGGGASGDW